MAMKFKNLKLTSKYSVGVYRSKIHGKGLFCLRDIEPGEMVIEYAGEVSQFINFYLYARHIHGSTLGNLSSSQS